jgi:Cytochrome P460
MKKTVVTSTIGLLGASIALITIAASVELHSLASTCNDKPSVAKDGDEKNAPAFLDKAPEGFRDWKVISVAHEEGKLRSLGVILGNDVAIKAYRNAKIPFPDGAIIAALHWRHTLSEENNKIFGQPQSFVAGSPTNVQFMVKDSKKHAATGGWGFGHFTEGTPAEPGALKSCFPCHQKIKERDLVFTRYAP